MIVRRVMNRIGEVIRITIMLFFILSTCAVGLFIFLPIPTRKGIGPYQEYTVKDVSKSQQFIIPSRFINPIVIRYRIEGVIDESATVTFRTEMAEYARISLKGVVADSAVRDFYESSDMLIIYQPKDTKKGHLVIKAALNW